MPPHLPFPSIPFPRFSSPSIVHAFFLSISYFCLARSANGSVLGQEPNILFGLAGSVFKGTARNYAFADIWLDKKNLNKEHGVGRHS